MKIKQRSNGDTTMPPWEQDDIHDKLAEQLVEGIAQADREIQAEKPTIKGVAVTPPIKPKETINVIKLVETLLAAYTAPDVHMWVDESELCFEQIVKDADGLFKTQWRLKIASYSTSSVKLIK